MGAALVAQAMSGGDASVRYKAMQAVKDWDCTRLGYRTVKRAFDIVFSGCVLAVIAIPSLVLAAAIRLESEGNPFYSQIRVGQTHRDGSLSTFRMWSSAPCTKTPTSASPSSRSRTRSPVPCSR